MVVRLKFRNAFCKQRRPRVDVIQFVGQLPRIEWNVPQVVEYTYTGEETLRQWPETHETEVHCWDIEHSNNPNCVMEILEQEGNWVKFQLKLLNEAAFSPLTNDPDLMNLRVFIYPNFIKDSPVEFAGSKNSKKYHECKCHYVKRIKYKVDISEEEKNKRTGCKVCIE